MNEILPWLNLLLVPSVGLLLRITQQLATLESTQRDHARRLEWLEKRVA